MPSKIAEHFQACCERAWALWRRLGFVIDTSVSNAPMGPVGLISNEITAYSGSPLESEKIIAEVLTQDEILDIRKGFRPLRTSSEDAQVVIKADGLEARFTDDSASCVIDGIDLSSRIISWQAQMGNAGAGILILSLRIESSETGCILDGIDVSEVIAGWKARPRPPEEGILVELIPKPKAITGVL